MAIDVSVGKDVLIGVLEQSTWGTAEASSSAFEIIKCDLPDIKPDVKIIDDKHSNSARYGDVADVIVHEKGALPRFTLNNILIRKDNLANFLYAFAQNVTEDAGTPFSKSFTFSTSGQVDFTNSEGFYMTAAQNNPGTTDDYKLHDCICEGLHFSLASGDSNILTMGADMVSRGAGAWTENMTGTWVLKDADYFYLEDITAFTFNHGGSISPTIKSLNIDVTQKVFGAGQDSGNYETYGLDEFGGTVKGSLFFEGQTADLLGYHRAGTAGEYTMTFGSSGVDGYLAFTFYGLLESTGVKVDDGLMLDFSLRLLGSSSGSKVPLTVVLCDAQDKTW